MTDRTIELTRTIDAPVPTVYRALTDTGELARWWTSSAESDARTGGSFSYRFEFDDDSRNHTYTGAYHEVIPNERVSYPWQGALGETRVDVSLRPAGDGTELTLVHSGWGTGEDWDAATQLHEQGWAFFLDNLKGYLERGEDARASQMGMKTPAAV